MVSFTLFSFLVSTAALVDKKIKGLQHEVNVHNSVHASNAEATDYVAVIATMPPAAPAKEWIVESPGIVESRNGGEGDGKCRFEGSYHLISSSRVLRRDGLMTRDIRFNSRRSVNQSGGCRLARR